jgi:hypothetical protein
MLKNTVRDLPTYISFDEFTAASQFPDRRQLPQWISEQRDKSDFAKYLKP